MWKDSDADFLKFYSVSKIIFRSFLFLFAIAGIMAILGITWLLPISIWLSKLSSILLIISWITPGLLVILNVPWLARGWLRGINPLYYSKRQPWGYLSSRERISVYIQSIVLFSFVVITLIFIISEH
jgi:hypothetical protein